ncbi:hypothetical protein [Caudoviricetes sp.]|nr:hypothetical protein [Caudoviricetes sp.]
MAKIFIFSRLFTTFSSRGIMVLGLKEYSQFTGIRRRTCS